MMYCQQMHLFQQGHALGVVASPLALVPVAEVKENVLQGGHVEPLQQLGGAVLCQQLAVPHHADDVGLPRLLDVVRRDDDGSAALGDLSERGALVQDE